MTNLIRHTHSSGHDEQTRSSLDVDLRMWSSESNLISLIGAKPPEEDFPALAGWQFTEGEGGMLLAHHTAVWELVRHASVPVDEIVRVGCPEDVYALFAVLRHRFTRNTVLFGMVETRLHVGSLPPGPKKMRKCLEAAHRITEEGENFAARWRIDARMLMVDSRCNIRQWWVRAGLRILFPDMSLTWVPPFPRTGTHRRGAVPEFCLIDSSLRLIQSPRTRLMTGAKYRKAFRQVLSFRE